MNISRLTNWGEKEKVLYPITGHIAVWKFNEESGAVIGEEISANNATVTGTTIVTGKLGNARSFDGTASDYAYANNLSIWNVGMTNDFSVIVWFNVNAFSNYGSVFYGGINSSNYIALSSSGTQQRVSAISRSNGTKIQKIVGIGDLSIGVWYHAVITWEATTQTMKFYINANEITATTADSGNIAAGGIWFGGASATTYKGNVKIDQMEVIDHILTQDEINNSYNLGNGIEYY